MSHLCIDGRLMGPFGIGTFLSNIVRELKKEPFKLTLLCKKNHLRAFEGVETIEVSSPIYSVKEHLELQKKIPPCALFWSPHFNVPLLPIKAKKRLVTVHDTYHLEYQNTFSWLKRGAAKCYYNGAFALSDCVVTDSYFSKEQIAKHALFTPKRTEVIYPGVDLSLFVPCYDPKRLKAVQSRYDLPEKFYLAVGNARPHKNLENVLRAYEKLGPKNMALVVVGKQIASEKTLIPLINHTPYLKKNVHFTGVVLQEDLPVIYSLATALCFPSFYEGYGFPPLEAFACQCPVIASNKASLPEVCGQGATLVDPTNISQIAQALTLSHDPKARGRHIEAGLQAVKHHSLQKSLSSYLALFRELVG